jgi:hypothetical protein
MAEIEHNRDLEQAAQVSYVPRSRGQSIETLCPTTMATAMQISLNRVEAVTQQSIDEFVAARLGCDIPTLHSRYAAEQIDGLAIAYFNQDRGRPTLIANDTGTGKGRIVSGLIAPIVSPVAENDVSTRQRIAVFITAKPDLYVDMLARDMVDTGVAEHIRPFFTNSHLDLALTAPDGTVRGRIQTPDTKQQEREIQRLIQQFQNDGTLGAYNCIFTTYDQLNQKGSIRRTFLETIPPSATFILDECDLGGGGAGALPKLTLKDKDKQANGQDIRSTAVFMTEYVLPRSDAYVLLSATAFRDPHVLTRLLASKSEIQEVGSSAEAIAKRLVSQGIPGQQDFTNKLALAGELVRLEKSMEGVAFQPIPIQIDLEELSAAIDLMAKIVEFDRAKKEAVEAMAEYWGASGEKVQASDASTGEASVDSTNFTSTSHNFTQQLLFSLKVDGIAQAAITSIEAGRKPKIQFYNTMQSLLEEYLSTQREDFAQEIQAEFEQRNEALTEPELERLTKQRYQEWLNASPVIDLDFGDLIIRQLNKCRTVTIGQPYGEKIRQYLRDDELSDRALQLDQEIRQQAKARQWTVPISPIDAILQKLRDAGYQIGEMSGRSLGIDYSSGVPTLKLVHASEPAVRSEVKNGYNNGALDAIITNLTTGWSGHASRSVKDQRQREDIVAQAHPDGNKFMQGLGRVNRTGQVNPSKHTPDWNENGNPGWGEVRSQHGIPGSYGLPIVSMVFADSVPYEQRIAATIRRKMDSLNANTTGSRQSAIKIDGPDFLNRHGDEVAVEVMQDFPDLHRKLDFPLGFPTARPDNNEGAINRVTGRSIFLSLPEQEKLMQILEENFNEYVAQREALGESLLEAQTLDLQAQTVGRMEVKPATSESLFAGASYVEVVRCRALRKPLTSLDVANRVRTALGLEAIASVSVADFAVDSPIRKLGREQAEQVFNQVADAVNQRVQELAIAIEQMKTEQTEKLKDIHTRLDALEKIEHPTKEQQKQLDKEKKAIQRVYKETESKNLEREQTALAGNLTRLQDRLLLCPVGQPVRLFNKEGALYGIVVQVKRIEDVQNPLAGGAWKFRIAVADAAREVTLKLSEINVENKCWIAPVEVGHQYRPPFESVPIHQLFNDLQKDSYETRQIVTGNLLASPLGKKYINFTNNREQVRQGLLLPREFDVEKALAAMPVVLETRDQQRQFLNITQSRGVTLKTLDEALVVHNTFRTIKGTTEPGLLLEVPSSKRDGSVYYKDPELMALTMAGEFAKRSKGMQGFVPIERSEQFLDVLERKFSETKLAVFDEKWKATAREVTGTTVQTMEWFKENQQIDLDATELEISTEQITDRIAALQEQRQAQEQLRLEQARQRLENQVEASNTAAERVIPLPDVEQQLNVFADSQDVQEGLILAYRDYFAQGHGFPDIRQARKFAADYLTEIGADLELTDKAIEECIEKGIVRLAKGLARNANDPLEVFDQLVELYQRQPRLTARTSTSILHQQYSTPIPIAWLAQQLGNITPDMTVYEPTAGNGSLLTNATPRLVEANEIDPKRAAELRMQGYAVTEYDAATYRPAAKSKDRVILNPPFGSVFDHQMQAVKRWPIELPNPAAGTREYETSQIDHVISFKTLAALKEEGRAVLVLGAPLEQKTGADSRDAYNTGQSRSFFYTLYHNYNVTQHFTVSGDLYAKQGTTFPIDVLVIEGRGKSELPLPAVQAPPVYRQWDELRQMLSAHLSRQQQLSGIATLERSLNNSQAESEGLERKPAIALVNQQTGAAAKNVARFLERAGLSETLLQGEEFHLRIENEPYIPLVIERQGDAIYFTHYLTANSDTFIDTEMVFQVLPGGKLWFRETAVQDPLRGGEHRAPDRDFAQVFSKNILEQGFAEAAILAWQKKQQTEISSNSEDTTAIQSEVVQEQETGASTCIALIEVGDIQVQVFEESDDYLRFEFRGETVNWCDYPSRLYEAQIHRDELAEMDGDITSMTAYAKFAAEQLHAEFLQALDKEVDRIQSPFRKWLSSVPEPATALADIREQTKAGEAHLEAFMLDYPERSRSPLSTEFMQLAVRVVAQQETERRSLQQPSKPIEQSKRGAPKQEQTDWKQIADQVRELPLSDVARMLGLEQDRHDPQKWKGNGCNISLYNHDHSFSDWYSTDATGKYGAIDLVMHVRGYDYKEALYWLAGDSSLASHAPAARSAPAEHPEAIPEKFPACNIRDANRWEAVHQYLVTDRKLPEKFIDALHQRGLIDADCRSNVMIFRHHLETDFQRGEAIGANLRGTIPDTEGQYFKGLTPGTKREEGFFWFQQGKGIVQQVVLTESGIDALSYATLHKRQPGGTVYLSTDGNGTIPMNALQQVLERGGTVILAQDNDRDGHRQAWEIARLFSEFRLIRQVPEGCKDWNDQLLGKPAEPWSRQEQSAQIWQWYAVADPEERQQVIEIGIECHATRKPRELMEQELEEIAIALHPDQSVNPLPIERVNETIGSEPEVEQPALFTLNSFEAASSSPGVVDPAWAEWTTPEMNGTVLTVPSAEAQQPSLQELRDWYRQAKDIGRSERHLLKIEQVGKAFREGQSLDDHDRQAFARDQAAWKQQVQDVTNHARTILEAVGKPSATGTLFEGKKHYTIFAQDDRLYVLATGHGILPAGDDRDILPDRVLQSRRGIILKLHQGEISMTATRITATDAKRFEQFANLVQSQQLQVVGYDR